MLNESSRRPVVSRSGNSGDSWREFVHGEGHGCSDYALYVDRQLVGVLEAKPDGTTLTEVERQTRKYIEGVPDANPAPVTPLPFGYEATGTESRFTCFSDPEPRSRRMFGGYIHRPGTLADWLARILGNPNSPTVRAGIRATPALNVERLWDAQVEAIQNTEQSLRENRPRALIQMATGSGKTYAAATLAYRLIEYADAARILFLVNLVDRRNLGRQAKGEFQRFDIPGSSRKFAEVYNIQHLTGPRGDKVSRFCISTVQRMYSILRGTDIDAEIDARSLYELQAPPEPIVYNPGCLGSQPEKIYRLPQLAFCQPDEADADNGLYVKPRNAVTRGDLSRRRPGMGRGRQDQALRRRLTRPWAAHRSARPRQAERPPATGNPPPFLSLRAPPGSTGRLLQLAEPPHPRRVTPWGGKQQRIRDDRAVRSPDSSREILRAIGADQRLRTSAPCRTARLPRHVPDLPARKLPLKLAPTLTVPHGLSPHPRSTRPSRPCVPPPNAPRQLSPLPEHDAPPAAADRGRARGSLQELLRLFDAPRPRRVT